MPSTSPHSYITLSIFTANTTYRAITLPHTYRWHPGDLQNGPSLPPQLAPQGVSAPCIHIQTRPRLWQALMACVGTQIHSYIFIPGGWGGLVLFDSPSLIKHWEGVGGSNGPVTDVLNWHVTLLCHQAGWQFFSHWAFYMNRNRTCMPKDNIYNIVAASLWFANGEMTLSAKPTCEYIFCLVFFDLSMLG